MDNQTEITTQINHGDAIGTLDGKPVIASRLLQNFFDDLVQKLNIVSFGNATIFPEYAKADLPSASANQGGQVNVTDEVGGYTPAFSDGTNWRRYTDRAVVS